MRIWEDGIKEIIDNPGTVMVIGAKDTGKSTFCLDAARAAFDNNIPTAIVDADVGQSDIGPPCTIAMSVISQKPESYSDLQAQKLHFVGSTFPSGHMMECINGTRHMVDNAKELGARLILINTTGYIDGYPARKLKTQKTDIVRPNYLVGLQRNNEIDPLLIPFTKVRSVRIIRIKTPDAVRTKTQEYRETRRRLNFASEFNNAPGHIIKLDSVSLWNTCFRTGRPVSWQYLKFIENNIKCRVMHAEIAGNTVFVVGEKTCEQDVRGVLSEEFKTSNIIIASTNCFTNLLCGLADENGNTLGIGLIQAVDFKQMFMFVLSSMKTISPVKVVQIGSIRVARDGRELGIVRPGEI